MMVISWSANILDAEGQPPPNLVVAVQVYAPELERARAAWRTRSESPVGQGGSANGKFEIAAPPGFAPAMRLIESGAADGPISVFVTAPRFAMAQDGTLMVSFGEVTRLRAAYDTQVLFAGPAGPLTERLRVAAVPLPAPMRRLLATAFEGRDQSVELDAARARISALESERGKIAGPPRERSGGTDAEASKAASAVAIGDFTMQVGEEVSRAHAALRQKSVGLGEVSILTRALVTERGARIQLPSAEELKSTPAGMLSEVAFSVRPDAKAAADAEGVVVPDVKGLTEGAARRVLASQGLRMDSALAPPQPGAPTIAPGQAMFQAPRPGERAPVGARVLVAFAQMPSPERG